MAFIPRLNDNGMLNNPMYYADNFYYQIGWGLPNCTAFCYGRIYEILNTKPTWCPRYDAGTWWNDWPHNKGQVPQLGAVVCYYDPYGYYAGHVSVVEEILPNGNIITSNSALNGDYFFIEECAASAGYIPSWAQARGYRLHGFMYLPGAPITSEWIKGNRYLAQAEMDNNAFLVYRKLAALGWTVNAICGLLGNFQQESTINPGIWEGLDDTDPNNGYGLAQWTPSTNWTNYATAQGWAIDDGNRQLEFCDTDPITNYIPTIAYPETLADFKASVALPEYLASAWLFNYERAGVAAEAERRFWARYYYDLFEGYTPVPPTPSGRVIGLKVWQMIKYRI